MYTLIRAEFFRCTKIRLFWLSLCLCPAAGIFSGCLVSANEENFFPILLAPSSLILGIFLSLNTGREYSDGTVRNKLIAGNTKTQIFLARLCCSVPTGALMAALFILPFSMLSAGTLHSFIPADILWHAVLTFILLHGTWAVIFTVVSSLISSREVGSIINLLLIILIAVICSTIEFELGHPEFIQNEEASLVPVTQEELEQIHNNTFAGSYFTSPEQGAANHYYKYETDISATKNPAYVQRPRRTILETVYYLLPSGQTGNYISYFTACFCGDDPLAAKEKDYKMLDWLPLYSLILMAVLSGTGLCLFRKKEFFF